MTVEKSRQARHRRSAREAAKLDAKEAFDVLIVGGGQLVPPAAVYPPAKAFAGVLARALAARSTTPGRENHLGTRNRPSGLPLRWKPHPCLAVVA